jgi:hypothetical protein
VSSNDFKEHDEEHKEKQINRCSFICCESDGTTSAVEKEEIEDKVFNFKIRICRDV